MGAPVLRMPETPTRYAAVAAKLAENGYRPVPIASGKKYPPLSKWQEFTYTRESTRHYGNCGAGILLGDVVAIDVDVDDPDAVAEITEELRRRLRIGDVAEIPCRTGREPRVLLPFRTAQPYPKRKSASFSMRSTGNEAHVEVLAKGQQFVAYHVHPETGGPYTWNGGDLLTVPRTELHELNAKQADEVIVAIEAILEQYGDRITPRAEEKKMAARGATIGEGGRNDALTRIAGRLRHAGLGVSEIAAALQQANVERCDPPLATDEIETIAKSVSRYEVPSDEPLWTLPEPISENEFAQAQLAPACIVEDYLFADVGVLVAPGGTGKTTLTLYEAICISLGLPVFGMPVRKPGPVLIVTAEDSREMLVARMRAIADAMQLTPAQRDIVRRDVRISDVSCQSVKLTLIIDDIVAPSPLVDDIVAEARALAPVLVSIDPAVSFGVAQAGVNDA
jgi:hypothetical protein